MTNQDVRCAIRRNATRMSPQDCSSACGKNCPFFMYRPSSTSRSNCWIADLSDSLTDCRPAEGSGYVLYTRKWKRYAHAMVRGGQKSAFLLTLSQCKNNCGTIWRGCVGFSRYNPSTDKQKRGADTALATCWWVDDKSKLVFDGPKNDKTLFITGGIWAGPRLDSVSRSMGES